MEEKQLKLAKMVIYAWIKDWSCLKTYMILAEKKGYTQKEAEEFCKQYPFFPSDWLWYMNSKGRFTHQPIRRYIADLNKKLSDALWDTEDNIKKLEFAKYLIKLDGTGLKIKTKLDKEGKKMSRINSREYIAIQQQYWKSKEDNQKLNGTHWKTVK
jgi:hypothetical protein